LAELRRLLIAPERLTPDRALQLSSSEAHYLRRVLRLRPGDPIALVDGQGSLWQASLLDGEQLQLSSGPSLQMSPLSPRLGLAVVGVRRGMDDLMRMATELGVDQIQPLRSQWRTLQAEDRPDRWQVILQEAVEQSERLWSPKLAPCLDVKEWWAAQAPDSALALPTTRQDGLVDLHDWLLQLPAASDAGAPREVWVAIGPEAGWSAAEEEEAIRQGWTPVSIGDTILRTSTAAIAAATLMTAWRRQPSPGT
jgi:16S rRNA (uracil1498-N3)-methyltransferase